MYDRLEIIPEEYQVYDGWEPDWYSLKTFWDIFVNGRLVADEVFPFTASEDELYFSLPIGISDFFVRRYWDTVLWIGNPYDKSAGGAHREFVEREQVFVFEGKEYQKVLSEGQYTELPLLRDEELFLFLLYLKFPDANQALYRLPESSNDPFGQRILSSVRRVIWERLKSLGSLESHLDRPGERTRIAWVVEPPAVTKEIRVGLDFPDIPEAVWEIGQTEKGFAVRFLENPRFPVWFSCGGLGEALVDESFE